MDEHFKRMEAALAAHAQFEVDKDLDGTMSTVSADPHYEYVTLGWRVDGRDAVREAYRRSLLIPDDQILSLTTRLLSVTDNMVCSEGFMERKTPQGAITTRHATILSFEGDLVSAEWIYLDPYETKALGDALGDDFADFPGVSRL